MMKNFMIFPIDNDFHGGFSEDRHYCKNKPLWEKRKLVESFGLQKFIKIESEKVEDHLQSLPIILHLRNI